MSAIELKGLRADLPLSALAAFGCLRTCDRLPELRGSRLLWTSGGGHPVLQTPKEVSREQLIALLIGDVKKAAGRMELTWSEQIKTADRTGFRENCAKALDSADAGDRGPADWFAAFGSELEVDQKGKIDSTPFDMSMARQKFLADARRLAAGLSEETEGRGGKSGSDAYQEALFGPWKYEDDQHSLGWDPSTLKLGAFTYKAPTSMANAGVRAAVWLAFESLPLFPCFSSGGLRVTGFRQKGREYSLCWPIWKVPISLEVLRSLLASVDLLSDPVDDRVMQTRGVIAVYRSAKFKPNQYLSSFRAPELVYIEG